MNILNIFHWSYWLKHPLIARDGSAIALWSIAAALLLAGIVGAILYFYGKKTELKKFYYLLATTGIIAGLLSLAWMFMRQQRVTFFSLRIWMFPLDAFIIYRAYQMYRFYKVRLPVIRQAKQAHAIKAQYLPKSR